MMEISTRGRYGARIMVRLALLGEEVPVRIKDVAEAEDISAAYVEQIILLLRRAGLVRSYKGVHGGVSIGRDPSTVTIADVLEATEGPLRLAPCITGSCARKSFCAVSPVWHRAQRELERIFSQATIAQLARQARAVQTLEETTS